MLQALAVLRISTDIFTDTICPKFILSKKLQIFIEIFYTKFFMSFQYFLLIIFMSCFARFAS